MGRLLKGLDLCEQVFHNVAGPVPEKDFPSLEYSAGLIGYCSDGLGFDDEFSANHMWGERDFTCIWMKRESHGRITSSKRSLRALPIHSRDTA